jgi:hypothetical protein
LNSIADNLSKYTEPGSEHLNALHNINFGLVGFMLFNATFNNISVISWLSVLLVEENGEPGENHRHAACH